MSKYAVYHRKMQHYFAYRVSLYKQQRHAIKAYFTYCSFYKDGTKGHWSQVWWESLLWGRGVENNSKLKWEKTERNRGELKEQTHRVQKEYYPVTVKLKDEMSCGTARFNNLCRIFYCHHA